MYYAYHAWLIQVSRVSSNANRYTAGKEIVYDLFLHVRVCDNSGGIKVEKNANPCTGRYNAGFLWNKISADTLCIQVCFCMLVISFYFVNCVIISCKLSFSSRFTRI